MRYLLLVLAALATAPAAWASTNLVVNGGFESVTGGTAVNGGVTGQFIPTTAGFTTYSNAEKTVQLTGWYETATTANGGSPFNFLVAPGTIFTTGFSDNWDGGYRTIHQGTALASAAYSPAGGNFLLMDSDYHTSAINQVINGLVDGGRYTLSFYWAASQWTQNTGATTQSIQTTIGTSTMKTITYSLGSALFSGWMQVSETFIYQGNNNILSFLAQGTPSGLPPSALLDGIVLAVAVPEPAGWGLLLLGLGALIAARRRR